MPVIIYSWIFDTHARLMIEYFFCTAGRWKFDKGTNGYGSLTNGEKTTLAGKWKIPEKGFFP